MSDVASWLIIPQDPNGILRTIDRNAKLCIEARSGLQLNDWFPTTITTVFIENAVKYLNMLITQRGIFAEINIYDMVTIKCSQRVNQDAEKEGNIQVIFRPGNKMKEILEQGPNRTNVIYGDRVPPWKEFGISLGDTPQKNLMKELCGLAYDECNTKYRFAIVGPEIPDEYRKDFKGHWAMAAVTIRYLETLYQEMGYQLANSKDESEMFINLNDLIEFTGIRDPETDEVKVYFKPGMIAKLNIKSDISTEKFSDDID